MMIPDQDPVFTLFCQATASTAVLTSTIRNRIESRAIDDSLQDRHGERAGKAILGLPHHLRYKVHHGKMTHSLSALDPAAEPESIVKHRGGIVIRLGNKHYAIDITTSARPLPQEPAKVKVLPGRPRSAR